MKILSFEGSAKVASVALYADGHTLASFTVDAGLTHSEVLLPMTEDLLTKLGLGFSDVDAFAVAVGPGSFTGIRICVATVKGLAFGRECPCVALSSLEVLAQNLCGCTGIIVPVIDCRRNECYTALFSSDGKEIRRLCADTQMPISQLAPLLSAYHDTPIFLVGDAYEKAHAILGELGVPLAVTPTALRTPSAVGMGALAHKKILACEVTDDIALSPVYLKPAQAERERLEREKNNKEIQQNA